MQVCVFLGLVLLAEPSLDEMAKEIRIRTERLAEKLTAQESRESELLERFQKGKVTKDVQKTTIPPKGFVRFPNKTVKDKTIADAEAKVLKTRQRLKLIANGEEWDFGELQSPLKLKAFGTLGSVRVDQVVDKSAVLIEPFLRGPGKDGGQKVPIMLRGINTKGVTDGNAFSFPGVFVAEDTETYRTVGGGSRTVFVVRPVDMDALLKLLKRPAEMKD